MDPVTPGGSTTTTDANGNYIFDDLPAGAYVVRVTDRRLPATPRPATRTTSAPT